MVQGVLQVKKEVGSTSFEAWLCSPSGEPWRVVDDAMWCFKAKLVLGGDLRRLCLDHDLLSVDAAVGQKSWLMLRHACMINK